MEKNGYRCMIVVMNFMLVTRLYPINYCRRTRVSYCETNFKVNMVLNIYCMGYNPKMCDLKSLLVI